MEHATSCWRRLGDRRKGCLSGNPPGGTLLVDGHVHRGEADAGFRSTASRCPATCWRPITRLTTVSTNNTWRTETLRELEEPYQDSVIMFADTVWGALQARWLYQMSRRNSDRTKWRSGCSGC
ncbi:MAG: hypothetical protein ACLRMJ_11090 [Alistipes finegoldii]